MGIKITIPNTSSDTLTFGSANTTTAAQIAGIDSGSSNGQLALYTTASGTSTERVRVDSSGNVGIGTASPGSKLQVSGIVSSIGSGTSIFAAGETGTYTLTGVTSPNYGIAYGTLTGRSNPALTVSGYDAIAFGTSQAERARIDSSGNLLVGTTSSLGIYKIQADATGSYQAAVLRTDTATSGCADIWNKATTGNNIFLNLLTEANGTARGSITYNRGGGLTAYNTTSDYRAKTVNGLVQNALSKVALLKPSTGRMNGAEQDIDFFVAHELQEIVPSAVTGDKDAVNEDGSPNYQMVDKSALIPLLTAAIQEQQALITQLQADVAALKGTA
jgi:hypothetical protein